MRRGLPVRAGLLGVLALLVAGCSRCGRKEGGAGDPVAVLSRALPRQSEAVVLVPRLALLGEKLATLQRLKLFNVLAQTQGAPGAEDYVTAVSGQLGVDLRSPESLRKAGLEPEGGAAFALLPGGSSYLLAQVSDATAFRDTVARLARDRLGAAKVRTVEDGPVSRTEFARAEGAPAELALILREHLAWLATGRDCASLGRWAQLKEEDSLGKDPAFSEGLARLPKEREAVVHLPQGSSWVQGRHLGGTTISGHLAAEGLVVRADLAGAGIGAFEARSGPDLSAVLPADAFAIARFGGEPTQLSAVWPALVGPRMAEQIRATGFDVEKQLLGNLQPGPLLTLSLAPGVKFAGGMPELNVRRTNPFAFVQLVSAARVKDPAAALAMLQALPPVAAKVGATLEPAERGGRRVWLTHYAQGEGAHLGLVEQTLVMAAPEARLLQTLARAAEPKQPAQGLAADPDARAFLAGHTLAVVLDLRRLADAVRQLPSEAWGLGGFAIKATTLRWLDATDDLLALEAGLSSVQGIAQAELTLRLRAPGPEGTGNDGSAPAEGTGR